MSRRDEIGASFASSELLFPEKIFRRVPATLCSTLADADETLVADKSARGLVTRDLPVFWRS